MGSRLGQWNAWMVAQRCTLKASISQRYLDLYRRLLMSVARIL